MINRNKSIVSLLDAVEEWAIEDVNDGPKLAQLPVMDRQSKFSYDSVLTNCSSYENLLEKIYEVY